MKHFFKSIDKRFYLFAAIWALVQFVLILIYFNAPMGNDALGYEAHAIQNYNLGTIYPSQANLYDIYVQAPGLVNALIPFYAVFGTVRAFMFMSWLMNIGILFEVLFVGFSLFNKKIGYIGAVSYALLLSNIFAATLISTEILYLFLALTGFCLTLSKKEYPQAFAGLSYAAAWTVRPLVLAFVFSSIILHLYRKKKWAQRSILNIIFLALPLVVLGLVNDRRLGTPIISSSTGGYNLLMTALPGATPLPNHQIYYSEDGFAHKDIVNHLTFYQRDKKWKDEGIALIKQHSGRYLVLCFERLGIMWNKDTWCVPNMFGHLDDTNYAIQTGSKSRFIVCQLIRMAYSLLYYIIDIFFLISLVRYRKQIFTIKGITLLILLLGIGGTCLFPMEHRYHYPYMWIVCLWAAMEIDRILANRKAKKNIR